MFCILLIADHFLSGRFIYTVKVSPIFTLSDRKIIDDTLGCKVNYHHNFYIFQGRRIYYSTGIPDVIQVGEHQFVERKVIELWITLMVVSWTSATNCARLYNSALSGNRKPPQGWKVGFNLELDHVWNGFSILSLLEDLLKRNQSLSVPHTGLDQDRYKEAMKLRNHRMRLYSQPEIRHYCNKCTRFTTDGMSLPAPI